MSSTNLRQRRLQVEVVVAVGHGAPPQYGSTPVHDQQHQQRTPERDRQQPQVEYVLCVSLRALRLRQPRRERQLSRLVGRTNLPINSRETYFVARLFASIPPPPRDADARRDIRAKRNETKNEGANAPE